MTFTVAPEKWVDYVNKHADDIQQCPAPNTNRAFELKSGWQFFHHMSDTWIAEEGAWSMERQDPITDEITYYTYLEESFQNPLRPTPAERALFLLEKGIEYPLVNKEVTV